MLFFGVEIRQIVIFRVAQNEGYFWVIEVYILWGVEVYIFLGD